MNKKTLLILIFSIFHIFSCTAQFKAQRQVTPFLTGGNQCPNYKFTNLKGDSVQISDLKGSYVYIDVWASWCGPCISAMAHLKKIAQEFKGRNIIFLSISLDKDSIACKKAVERHLISNKVWLAGPTHQMTKDFDIRSIPRFILIDPQGIIIHNRMSRPEYPPTSEILKRLVGM